MKRAGEKERELLEMARPDKMWGTGNRKQEKGLGTMVHPHIS